MKLVESISRIAQKQGQSRLRSCLASLDTVPVFEPAIDFSPAPIQAILMVRPHFLHFILVAVKPGERVFVAPQVHLKVIHSPA